MIQPGEALKAVQAFFNAYLVQRDVQKTLAGLMCDVQWVGTGKCELVYSRKAVERLLQEEFEQSPESCYIHYDSAEETIISQDCSVVLLTVRVFQTAKDDAGIEARVTATCTTGADGSCLIAAIHASTADDRQEEGIFFPSSSVGRSEQERRMGGKVLDILEKSIPGGMMGGYLEHGFPLYFVNDQMLSYLGFTYDGFVSSIQGKVVNCIHPDDRARVEQKVCGAFQQDREYEIQYRIRNRDGSHIWVNDIGKKGVSEDGREVYISVIRDISAEIGAREFLKQQAVEQERQARQYDSLFQSVLCGIVQYYRSKEGVIFKNANHEAIRIFGYEPKAFWAKRTWDLAGLIAEEDRKQVLEEIDRLQRVGDKGSYEYRLLQKDGSPCWIIGSAEIILDTEGDEVIQSVFLDIDSRKKAELNNRRLEQQVEASNEIFRMALEHTTTCEFYYYPQTRVCLVPERTCQYYHCEERFADMPRSFALTHVDKKDWPAFFDMFDQIHQGARTASCEFRSPDGSFWCRETLSVIQSGEDGSPQFVIGIAEDATRQKQMEIALEETRSRDSLTGLYNKETGIRLVQEYISQRGPGEHGVLMLLDMDDFESINREEGSVFADAILQEVADILQMEAGPNSIPIRLGGDEFMLCIKQCDRSQATVIGPRIAKQVQEVFVQTEKNFRVSVSIGMCSTEVVGDYNTLYRCAESTLKYVKEHSRGQAACYLDTSNELGVFLTQIYTEEHLVNAIDRERTHKEEDLVSFALELLGKSKNLNDAVFLLLARIGKSFHFDRVSILEANRAFLTYRFTYQWSKSQARLQMGQDFYMSLEEFDTAAHMYDEEGLCDHNINDNISEISSCLHAAIWNYGEYSGSMSFEIDEPHYAWTRQQRKLLKELVKIVPSFIMKAKADAVSQAKTDFLSRMSHEIRTPMNAISGMTTIAKSVLGDRDRTLECLDKIESANAYLLSLINDILDMSRIESGKLELNRESVDLADQLAGMEALMRPQAMQKQLDMCFENEYLEGRPLLADGLRLNQVLVNIIGNAIKFTEAGGRVRVHVSPESATEQRVLLRFSVSDTGVGIESSALERIFNPFEQAEKSTATRHGGTGLGLSISSRLVQMMGGSLEVQSVVGKGSKFSFTLSFEYAEDPRLAVPAQERPGREWNFGGCHVLLAEDNALNREIAQTILEMKGFRVTCAMDGQEALDLFCQKEPGTFQAILMDIRMPKMDGLEASRRIRTCGRSDARTVPILALTANAFDEDSRKSLESGMNGHLSKPIQVDRMLEMLRRCMDESRGGTEA